MIVLHCLVTSKQKITLLPPSLLRSCHEELLFPASATASAAAATAVEVVAGWGQLDEGSIAARAAPLGSGPAVGGAAP